MQQKHRILTLRVMLKIRLQNVTNKRLTTDFSCVIHYKHIHNPSLHHNIYSIMYACYFCRCTQSYMHTSSPLEQYWNTEPPCTCKLLPQILPKMANKSLLPKSLPAKTIHDLEKSLFPAVSFSFEYKINLSWHFLWNPWPTG